MMTTATISILVNVFLSILLAFAIRVLRRVRVRRDCAACPYNPECYQTTLCVRRYENSINYDALPSSI